MYQPVALLLFLGIVFGMKLPRNAASIIIPLDVFNKKYHDYHEGSI